MTQHSTIPFALHSKKYPARQLCALLCSATMLLFTAGDSLAASFNCKNAKSATEKIICADKELGALDSTLAQTYQTIRMEGDRQGDLANDQKKWLNKVRDTCTTAACLKAAYNNRIQVLSGTTASFDCNKAQSDAEKLICSDGGLRYADLTLSQAYRAVRDGGGDRESITLAQKSWLDSVRNPCANIGCMQAAMQERNEALVLQLDEMGASLRKEIGYSKKVFHSHTMLWPKDPARMIAIFATQESAAKNPDGDAAAEEDYVLDMYVLDSKSHKVLQHGEDSIASDAVALRGLGIASADYSTVLGVQAFGVSTSYMHNGCGSYSGDSIRLYAINGKTIQPVLHDISVDSSSGMCQTECESSDVHRDLQFSPQAGKPYPDLTVRESKVELRDAPARKKGGACKKIATHREYKLRFDGERYPVPEGLEY